MRLRPSPCASWMMPLKPKSRPKAKADLDGVQAGRFCRCWLQLPFLPGTEAAGCRVGGPTALPGARVFAVVLSRSATATQELAKALGSATYWVASQDYVRFCFSLGD